jgi:hypothetical protein
MAVKLDNLPVFLSYKSIFLYFFLIEHTQEDIRVRKGVGMLNYL